MNNTLKTICLFCLVPLALFCAPLQFVSHAGDASSAPSHSIPAYKVALENKADILKLDIHFTKDKVIVLQHDATLERKMGWKVKIRDLDYKDILANGTYKKVKEFDKEKIVTLEQAFELIKDTTMSVWLDTKSFSPEIVEKAIELLKKYDIKPERVMFATFSVTALRYVRDHHPEYRRVLHVSVPAYENGFMTSFEKAKAAHSVEEIKQILKDKAAELKLYGYNFPVASPIFGKEMVQFLKDQGLWVSLWFVQNEDMARKAVEAGGCAVVTDHIKIVKAAARAAEAAQEQK